MGGFRRIVRRECWERLGGVDAVILPGGFGQRGIDGLIAAVRYARENNVPFFGICLGMQIALVEYARNVAGMPGHTAPKLIRKRSIRLLT